MRKKAVALKYDQKKSKAPTVTAKGQGLVAEKIIELAKEHGVFVHHDADMVEILSKIDIGEEIPEYLYKAVAEILAFIYKLNNNKKTQDEKAKQNLIS